MEHAGDIQRGRVPDVVGVRLERSAQGGDPYPEQLAAVELADEVDGALAPPLVDRVDVPQEGNSLADAERFGPVGEGPDVLGQAAAAETKARLEEPAADPGVVGERLGKVATSAPVVSQTSAMALMYEIFVARNEFAATFTSSAVARSVMTRGFPPR